MFVIKDTGWSYYFVRDKDGVGKGWTKELNEVTKFETKEEAISMVNHKIYKARHIKSYIYELEVVELDMEKAREVMRV